MHSNELRHTTHPARPAPARCTPPTTDAPTVWCELTIEPRCYEQVEHVAAHTLRPLLHHLHATDLISDWWYIRKRPQWRLRYRAQDPHRATAYLNRRFRKLTEHGTLATATPTIYEPEVIAFGGCHNIAVAHDLFAADSSYFLDHLYRFSGQHRRELSILLCTHLLRGAGLDWWEQGDVWSRVAQQRRPYTPIDADIASVRRLMTIDVQPSAPTATAAGHTLDLTDWIHAFDRTGQALRRLTRNGCLTRGLRAVLAHHVVYSWNRHGIPTADQAALAQAATSAVFHNDSPRGRDQL